MFQSTQSDIHTKIRVIFREKLFLSLSIQIYLSPPQTVGTNDDVHMYHQMYGASIPIHHALHPVVPFHMFDSTQVVPFLVFS